MKENRKIRTVYDRESVTSNTTGPSLTKQSFKDETDINLILKKYEKTGVITHLIESNPVYGDFSDVGSYQEALQIVTHAHEQFEALPAKLRDMCQNDPSKFLAWVENASKDELKDYGLLTQDAMKAMDAIKNSQMAPEASEIDASAN